MTPRNGVAPQSCRSQADLEDVAGTGGPAVSIVIRDRNTGTRRKRATCGNAKPSSSDGSALRRRVRLTPSGRRSSVRAFLSARGIPKNRNGTGHRHSVAAMVGARLRSEPSDALAKRTKGRDHRAHRARNHQNGNLAPAKERSRRRRRALMSPSSRHQDLRSVDVCRRIAGGANAA